MTKTRLLMGIGVAALSSLFIQPVLADDGPVRRGVFNPQQSCDSFLPASETFDKIMIGLWAAGYQAGISGSVASMTEASNDRLIEQLNTACAQTPQASLLSLIESLGEDKPKSAQNLMQEPGSPAQGRQILLSFLEPGADLAALTASLKPTPEDIRAIYADPLATSLIAAYEQAFASGAAIEPGEERDALLSTFTTTFELKNGAEALGKFPGGYKDVAEYFVADAPIASFKFVRQGESTGLAIAGFTYVNERWVLMPKPWRGL